MSTDTPENPELLPAAELAKYILDHEFSPGTNEKYRLSWREQLLIDYNTEYEVPNADHVLFLLKQTEDGYDVTRRERIQFGRHALSVIKAYIDESRALQASYTAQANPGKSDEIIPALNSDESKREAQNLAETSIVEQMNMERIKKLVLILAKKLAIELTAPDNRHGRGGRVNFCPFFPPSQEEGQDGG